MAVIFTTSKIHSLVETLEKKMSELSDEEKAHCFYVVVSTEEECNRMRKIFKLITEYTKSIK